MKSLTTTICILSFTFFANCLMAQTKRSWERGSWRSNSWRSYNKWWWCEWWEWRQGRTN